MKKIAESRMEETGKIYKHKEVHRKLKGTKKMKGMISRIRKKS